MNTITIEQYIEKYGDKDGIQWNYNHIGRYANQQAALQFITARANASHCSIMSIAYLDQYEDSNYTDTEARRQSDEWHRQSKEWHKVADSFREVMHQESNTVSTGLERDGEPTGISQEMIF